MHLLKSRPGNPRPSPTPTARLLLISPCRDEAAHARTTIESVLHQTIQPSKWIIVDDGSTDGTPDILAEYAREHDWIEVLRREDRGLRAVGPGVVDAFYAGLDRADLDQFDFLCKLDLDLDLPPRYFETLLNRMEEEPRLGTCSGKPFYRHPISGALLNERIGDDVSAGMTKLYRTQCFREIGGFVREVSWDGIDCHHCRMRGWLARSWNEPDLRFVHLRQMGSSHQSLWNGRLRWGRGKWFMGSSLPYVLGVSLFRAVERPYIVGGAGILLGYLQSMIRRLPRYRDREYRRFLRRYERLALLLGKRRALNIYEQRIRSTAAPENGSSQ